MRLYTVQIDKCQQLAIEGGGRRLYLLKDFGIKYEDMNELITGISDAELEEVKCKAGQNDFLDALRSYSLDEVHICAPIPKPMQDIICLGVNYEEHIQEVGVKTKGYTVYFSKRVNEASAVVSWKKSGRIFPNGAVHRDCRRASGCPESFHNLHGEW